MGFGPHAYLPKDFLEVINRKPEQGDMLQAPDWEFIQKFDLIFVGTCSSGHGHGYFHHTLKWDKDFSRTSVNPKFFNEDMEEIKPRRVLLLSECCGQFGENTVEELEQMYPGVEWVAPTLIADYCENATTDRVIFDLVAFGIIQRKAS